MIDPAKLLASATRLYGDQMDTLWGAFLPVPAANVKVLKGGERIAAAGTTLQVAYTPGHAKHHVSYLDETTGMAYVGDTGGIRVSGDYLIAPTPPPDIDLAGVARQPRPPSRRGSRCRCSSRTSAWSPARRRTWRDFATRWPRRPRPCGSR